MNLLRAVALAVTTYVSFAASAAVTLAPLPGSTPQTAHPLSNFGVAIGVVATDGGAPVQALPVTFELPVPGLFVAGADSNSITVTTDAQGIARLPEPGATAANLLGTLTMQAHEPGGATTDFTLSVAGTYPAQVNALSGGQQVALEGRLFPLPFVVQVLGTDGIPIPYPLVLFSGQAQTVPSGTFGGKASVFAVGDANGIATSPPFTADFVSGSDVVIALGESVGDSIAAFFGITIVPPVTLAPVAGSTPQTTRLNSFFPVRIGVLARFADGTPAPGVMVTFAAPFDSIAIIPGRDNAFDAVTGEDGIAWASSEVAPQGYIAVNPGASSITATSVQSLNEAHISLATAGKPGSRLELIAGDGQLSAPGSAYAPWIVRAWDEDNQAVPFAAVMYNATQLGAAATFENGSGAIYVPADAHGIAASPRLIANGVEGAGGGSASLQGNPLDDFSPFIPFSFTNRERGSAKPLRAWDVPPHSLAVGATTAIGFSVRATDAAGQALAGVSTQFAADPRCATFGGASTFTAVTGPDGVASSSPLTGVRNSTSCAVSAKAAGQTLDLSIHVFDPGHVAAVVSPPLVHAQLGSAYSFNVQLTERGSPVQLPNFDIRALAPGSASYARTPAAAIVDGSAKLSFMPNESAGVYAIEFRSGPTRVVIPVVQGP